MATLIHSTHPISAGARPTRLRVLRCRPKRELFRYFLISNYQSQHQVSTLTRDRSDSPHTMQPKLPRGSCPYQRPIPFSRSLRYLAPSSSRRGFTSSSVAFQNGTPTRTRDFYADRLKGTLQRRKANEIELGRMTHIKDVMKKGQLEDLLKEDFGAMPGTVVLTSARPPLFSKRMWTWTKILLKYKFQSWATRMVYKFQTIKKPRPKIESNRQLVPIAKDLYERMNAAFARGDKTTLKDIACGGLIQDLGKRIDARPPHSNMVWGLIRYTQKPKVVSHRSTLLPHDFTRPDHINPDKQKRSAIRQVVVRLSSVQVLSENTKGDTPEQLPSAKERHVTEYVLIQKFMHLGKENKWRIWGTIKGDMTLEEINEAQALVNNRASSISSILESAQTGVA